MSTERLRELLVLRAQLRCTSVLQRRRAKTPTKMTTASAEETCVKFTGLRSAAKTNSRSFGETWKRSSINGCVCGKGKPNAVKSYDNYRTASCPWGGEWGDRNRTREGAGRGRGGTYRIVGAAAAADCYVRDAIITPPRYHPQKPVLSPLPPLLLSRVPTTLHRSAEHRIHNIAALPTLGYTRTLQFLSARNDYVIRSVSPCSLFPDLGP